MKTPQLIATDILKKLREHRPLVLNLTNSVVQNITANMLLSTGAVPVMLTHSGEICDLLHSCANGLLCNVGTLSEQQAATMLQAVTEAGKAGVPWVLDPVAVGLLRYRTDVCHKMLQFNPPAMIRGNASEIISLAGATGELCRGVESAAESSAAISAAQTLARRTGAAVLVTGATDYATDGHTTIACHNGHEIMTRVTGVGCAMGGLAAACTAVADSPLEAAIATAAILGLAGERAAEKSRLPGTFATLLLDELAAMTEEAAAHFRLATI